MKDKNTEESRRKLLKSIAIGSGVVIAGKSLPESWSRPVVDSVMLPAHAETSPAEPTDPAEPADPAGCSTTPASTTQPLSLTDIPGADLGIPDSGNGTFTIPNVNPPSGNCTDTTTLAGTVSTNTVVVSGGGGGGTRTAVITLVFDITCGGIPTCTYSYLLNATEQSQGTNVWDYSGDATLTCCEDRQTVPDQNGQTAAP